MRSPFCEMAIEMATTHGNALMKYISANDVGLTGGHQYGYYLPKKVWQMFTPHSPQKGLVRKHDVRILWQDNVETDSVITWYGAGTRSEYRLTKFGRKFPYLSHDMVGDLLILIRKSPNEFLAFVLDLEDDISEIQARLGVEVTDSWGVYREGEVQQETEEECVERHFRSFASQFENFPSGDEFSELTRRALTHCDNRFSQLAADDALMKSMDAEYNFFKIAERQLCQGEVIRVFRDIDDFLKTASSILNRRKSRAGRSLENHVEHALKLAGVPHKMRPAIDGKPDIVMPNEAAYFDDDYPTDKIVIVGVKTTCKDRWRQVLNEGKRVPEKYLFTIQPGISTNQLNEMYEANVKLVVPKKFHKYYPRASKMKLLGVDEFIASVRSKIFKP